MCRAFRSPPMVTFCSPATRYRPIYGHYFGGSSLGDVQSLSLTPDGNVLPTRYARSTDFPATADALQAANAGNGDAFITVLDLRKPSRESLLYSTYLGGAGGDVGYDAKTDSAGNIYVAGYTLSRDFPIAGNPPQGDW